jgi:hypothetical protein
MPRFDNLLARVRNQFFGAIEKNIVFVHIPKCGGTSLSEAISRHYYTLDIRKDRLMIGIDVRATYHVTALFAAKDPFEDDYHEVLRFEERLLLYYMHQKDLRYIHGHFAFSELAYQLFGDRFQYVTMLRDPVERIISHFLYNKFKQQAFGIGTIDEDINNYMNSDRFRNQGHEYVKKFFGTFDRSVDYTSSEAIDRAKANLRKFAVVGCLENLESFASRFEKCFGVKLQLPVKNVSPKSGSFKRTLINDEIKNRIASICKPDLEIYTYALNSLDRT